MNKIKLLCQFFLLMITLSSCSGLSEAGKVLRNEKNSTTDEFLIKKQDPLTQPPDFKIIPKPGSIIKKADEESNNFEKILRKTKTKTKNNSSQKEFSSTESSILNKIKK